MQPVQHTPSHAPEMSANCRWPAFITTCSSLPGADTSQKLVQLPVAKGAPLHMAIRPAPAAVAWVRQHIKIRPSFVPTVTTTQCMQGPGCKHNLTDF